MNIFFIISAPLHVGDINAKIPNHPHLGVSYIMAVMKQYGHSVGVMDMRLGYSDGELVEKIRHFDSDIIAVSTFSCYGYLRTCERINFIRDALPDIPVVVGGHFVTIMGNRVLEMSNAQYAIKGEGEYAMLELLEALEGKKHFQDVDGLFWKSNGKMIENRDRPFIDDLDALPFPVLEDF